MDDPLDTACQFFLQGPCPSFEDHLQSLGFFGDPALREVDAFRWVTSYGQEYDAARWRDQDNQYVYSGYGNWTLEALFSPEDGQMLGLDARIGFDIEVPTDIEMCCDTWPLEDLSWGSWSHHDVVERIIYEPSDFTK